MDIELNRNVTLDRITQELAFIAQANKADPGFCWPFKDSDPRKGNVTANMVDAKHLHIHTDQLTPEEIAKVRKNFAALGTIVSD